MNAERDDLRKLGVNNATNAFKRTGLYPLNPFSETWTNAINTIGKGEKPSTGANYEIFVNANAPKLADCDSKLLRQDLENVDGLHDIAVAHIRGMHILARWRDDIKHAVSEGEVEDTYSNTLLPSAKTPSECVATQLVHFKKIDCNQLIACNVAMSKEEKAAELTRTIITTTRMTEPISVTYLSTSDSDSDAENSDSRTVNSKASGSATKVRANTWHVSLDNGTTMTTTDDEMMNAKKFFVQQNYIRIDSDDGKKRKQSAKQKRARKAEQLEREKRIQKTGMEKLREQEFQEYNNIREKFESGGEYKFEEFLEMIDRLRKPFVCQVEGHEVSLAQDDCAIMMETSTVRAITQSLFVGKEKQSGENQNKRQRQQHAGATVRTKCGATGLVALHQTSLCDNRLSKIAIKKAKDKLGRESKNILTMLTSLVALKQKKPDLYWIFTLQSSQQELSMIICLLAPDSGMISKGKQVM